MRFIPKTKLGKIFFVIVIIVFLAFLASLAWDLYGQYKGEKDVERLAYELQRWQESEYQKKADDKLGGKTPQETLEMFIAAVEKGDYELASKYFVIEEQARWRKDLMDIVVAKKIDLFLKPLKEIKNSEGAYLGEDRYFIDAPVLVDYLRYPFGNWKIEKI